MADQNADKIKVQGFGRVKLHSHDFSDVCEDEKKRWIGRWRK
jgi:hypothetical protein